MFSRPFQAECPPAGPCLASAGPSGQSTDTDTTYNLRIQPIHLLGLNIKHSDLAGHHHDVVRGDVEPRVGAAEEQEEQEPHLLGLSPFLSSTAPTYRPSLKVMRAGPSHGSMVQEAHLEGNYQMTS